ncbi:MAG TPA: NAD-dependent epimerase/dehydratase family protein [bacterium]|nr:NAD-dependent epimerase/dehydratase family protein [bacterium]
MKTLITGATGFIGSHIAEACADKGWEVKLLVRDAGRLPDEVKKLSLETFIGDVRDAESLLKAMKGMELIVHSAALVGEWGDPKDFYDINVQGMANMIDAAEKTGTKRLIDISSTSVHGYEGFNRDTEDMPYKKTGVLYSDTKLEAEKLVWEAHAQGRVIATTIRPCMVWGPRDRAYFTKIIEMLKKRRMMYVNGGKNIAGLSHVRNICDAILLAAEKEEAQGKAFIITDDSDVTLREVVEKLCESLSLKKPIFGVSHATAKLMSDVSERIFRKLGAKNTPMLTRMGVACVSNNFSFDISRAKNILGYAPRYTFPGALPEYIAWHKSEISKEK